VGEFALAAEERNATGKGVARKLRADGRIPGVIYGRGRDARAISLDPRALERVLHSSGSGANTLIDLSLAGSEVTVLVKEIQRDPVRGSYMHADLFEVDMAKKVEVAVPMHFTGKSAGVELGGLLDHPLRELTLACLPAEIPEFIEVDVSALEIGDSIHVREIALPSGAELVTDPDLTVASVAAPKAEEEEVAVEGEEAAEGEAAEGEAAAASADDAAAPAEGSGDS